MNRTNYIIIFLITGLFLSGCDKGANEERQRKKDEQFHQKLLTIDTHADTPLMMLRRGWDISIRNDPGKRGGKIDFPRMKEGGLDGVFFAVYTGQGPHDQQGIEHARQEASELFDTIHAVIKRYSDMVQLGLTSDDLEIINKNGRLAIFIGMENGYPIGKDLSLVKEYYDLGTRYITLCHSSNNDICDSSTDRDGSEHEGLSAFGEEMVKEMNRLGIIIDLSHASDETFYDVLRLSQAPVIASHSGARAILNHPRNLNDSMLLSLAEKNGVIQVCLVGEYVRETEPFPERDSARMAVVRKYGRYDELSDEAKEAFLRDSFAVDSIFPPHLPTVSDFVDHIDHIVEVAGIDHVGIGSDFDGGGALEDCYDVSEMDNITYELLRRGYSKEEIRKIWSGNFLRVFREVERVSREIGK